MSNIKKSDLVYLNKYNLANIFSIIQDENENYVFNVNDTLVFDVLSITDSYYDNYPVKLNDTYHGIAHRFYGNRRLWWIITKFNDIKNVIDLPKRGTILKVPSKEVVNLILNTISSSN